MKPETNIDHLTQPVSNNPLTKALRAIGRVAGGIANSAGSSPMVGDLGNPPRLAKKDPTQSTQVPTEQGTDVYDPAKPVELLTDSAFDSRANASQTLQDQSGYESRMHPKTGEQ